MRKLLMPLAIAALVPAQIAAAAAPAPTPASVRGSTSATGENQVFGLPILAALLAGVAAVVVTVVVVDQISDDDEPNSP